MSGTLSRQIKTTAERIYSMRVLEARVGDAAQAGRALLAHDPAVEADQNRCEGRAPWPLCHMPVRECPYPQSFVRRNPVADRWLAAGPFAAMTDLDPKASGPPDGEVMQRECRSTPSALAPNCPNSWQWNSSMSMYQDATVAYSKTADLEK